MILQQPMMLLSKIPQALERPQEIFLHMYGKRGTSPNRLLFLADQQLNHEPDA